MVDLDQKTNGNREIKVVHIFAPNVKTRFGGQIYTWRHNFSNWNDPGISHFVLDTVEKKIVDAKEFFTFQYSTTQELLNRSRRTVWAFSLIRCIHMFRKDFDILHIHILWWGSLLVGLLAKVMKIPVIYESVLQGADTPEPIIREKLGNLKLYLLRSFQSILAISPALADDYLRFGFSRRQVYTLTNSVDLDLFKEPASIQEKNTLRKEMNIPVGAVVLLFVGSVIKRKGVDILVQSFIDATKKNPNLFLFLVGPRTRNENPSMDEGFIEGLVDLISQAGLSDRVRFAGLIQDRDELARVYQAADIFIFPSRDEGLGNVVLEAMASGLPVIVSPLPCLVDIIKHEKNGFVVSRNDHGALTESILQLSLDPELCVKIGKKARKHVEEKHAFNVWQTGLVELYRNLSTFQDLQ